MWDERRLGPRVRFLGHSIRLAIDRNLAAMDLTGQQAFILRYLSDRADCVVYPKDIERRFHLTHPTVSGLLQRLEDKGYIVCVPEPNDRRCKRVCMTPAAREVQSDIWKHINLMEQVMTTGMTEADIDTFIRLLELAAQNLADDAKRAEHQKEELNP